MMKIISLLSSNKNITFEMNMNMNIEDLNKFSIRDNKENLDQGIELQYRVAEGININIPVQ
jgi:hypothetical protein